MADVWQMSLFQQHCWHLPTLILILMELRLWEFLWHSELTKRLCLLWPQSRMSRGFRSAHRVLCQQLSSSGRRILEVRISVLSWGGRGWFLQQNTEKLSIKL